MKKVIGIMMLLAGSLAAAPRIAVGIGFGAPAPVVVVRPPCPGPGYVWMNGYWNPPAVVRVGPRFEHFDRFDHRFDRFHR